MDPQDNHHRRHFTAEQKVALLRLHLVEHVPISDLCQQHQIQPSVFYRWQQEFFENGAAAFTQPTRAGRVDKAQQTIARLEEKLQVKDQVIAEIMEEMVRTKKDTGRS